FLSSGAPLVRKCYAEAVGGYDATLASRGAPCCEDLKFNLDIAERCDFDLVPEFLFSYRVRVGSMSTNIDAMLRSRKVVIEEARGFIAATGIECSVANSLRLIRLHFADAQERPGAAGDSLTSPSSRWSAAPQSCARLAQPRSFSQGPQRAFRRALRNRAGSTESRNGCHSVPCFGAANSVTGD